MKENINVMTGEVKAAGTDSILKSTAIGSCVVIVSYDAREKVGAMAHIMLPGASGQKSALPKTKYAEDAIEELLSSMIHLAADKKNIQVCLVGGANVLKRKNDSVGKTNIDSVTELLAKQNIEIKAKSLGGYERMSATLDVKNGNLFHSIGDEEDTLLYCFLDVIAMLK